MSDINIYVNWRTAVTTEAGEAYFYPDAFGSSFRRLYSIPAIYRWRVLRHLPEVKELIYVGEAENLIQRIQRVRTPSQKSKNTNTNKRLHQIFQKYLSEGRKIVIDVADIEPLEINGERFSKETMSNMF